MADPDQEEPIADGVPMTLDQMRDYSQHMCGFPVVLRQKGSKQVMCPHCDKNHTHDPGTGHHPAQCAEEDRCKGIVIGDRSFIPACGYTTLECMSEGNVSKLIN